MSDARFISINGDIRRADEPILDINNRAFRYGDALFETIRAVNGKPCFVGDHMKRVRESSETIYMEWPEAADENKIKAEINELLQKNNLTEGGRIRFTLFRNSGGYYTPETNKTSYLIETEPYKDNLHQLNEKGYTVDLYEKGKINLDGFSTLKSANSLFHIMAGLYKKEKGLDECILLNNMGSISEAISANVFVVFNGVLYTPSLNQGCVPGVMRNKLIEIAGENRIEVQECPLNPAVLLKADELFLTNSIIGIKWVLAYRSKRYFNKMSKLLVDKLNEKVTSSAMDLQES